MVGCSKPAKPQAERIEGSIHFGETRATETKYGFPNSVQLEPAYNSLRWDNPEVTPRFAVNLSAGQDLEIVRGFEANGTDARTYEQSKRIVALWHHDGAQQQCELKDAAQGLELVKAFALGKDISAMADWHH